MFADIKTERKGGGGGPGEETVSFLLWHNKLSQM